MKLFTITGMKVSEGIHSNNINIPFVDGMLKLLAGIENGVVVKTADITTLKDGTQRIVREGHYNDRRALVFLTCPADCQLRFMANTIDEVIENGLVRRVPRGIGQSVGVSVLRQDETGVLVELLPRASFRLSYEGHRPTGVPPQAVVLWSGRYSTISPCSGLNVYARINRL
jgi:hypothetical protein